MTGPPDDQFITLGELGRRLADVQATVHGITDRMERDYIQRRELEAVDKRVTTLEGTVGWVVKLVLGCVITALMGLVLVQGARGR